MKFALIVAAAIALAGCDSEVGRTYYAEDTRTEYGTQSCSKGPGSQRTLVKVIPYTVRYESGRAEQREARQVIQTFGVCQ